MCMTIAGRLTVHDYINFLPPTSYFLPYRLQMLLYTDGLNSYQIIKREADADGTQAHSLDGDSLLQ